MSFASDFNMILSILDDVLDDRNAYGAKVLGNISGAFIRLREMILEFGEDFADSELLEDVMLYIS